MLWWTQHLRNAEMSAGLIERIAHQLCVAVRIDPNKHRAGNEYAMGAGRHSAWVALQGTARAVLEAMRENSKRRTAARRYEHLDRDDRIRSVEGLSVSSLRRFISSRAACGS